MFYQPEVFVYLMLLPVFCFIVLPALFSATRLVIGTAKQSQLAKRDSELSEQEQVYEQEVLA